MLPNVDIETRVCYWCNSCEQFVEKNNKHDGQERTCDKSGIYLSSPQVSHFPNKQLRVVE